MEIIDKYVQAGEALAEKERMMVTLEEQQDLAHQHHMTAKVLDEMTQSYLYIMDSLGFLHRSRRILKDFIASSEGVGAVVQGSACRFQPRGSGAGRRGPEHPEECLAAVVNARVRRLSVSPPPR